MFMANCANLMGLWGGLGFLIWYASCVTGGIHASYGHCYAEAIDTY